MNYLDRLPVGQQERIKQRLRTPEQYEMLRQCVKGPEDLKRELDRAEVVAEARFQMESEPEKKEQLKLALKEDLENDQLSLEIAKEELLSNNFDVSVESHPETHKDQLAIKPSGNVSETIWLEEEVGDGYLGTIAT